MPYKDPEKQRESRRKWKLANPEYMQEYNKKYKESNKEKISAYNKQYEEQYKHKRKGIYVDYKSKFFEMYGSKCVCCGETIPEFLTLEHKLGQVGKTKESWSYRKATNEYRPDLYEVLCMNCNFSKGIHGICPHKTRKV